MNKATTPRNLLKLTGEEKRNFLSSFDHVFSDIDGVIWNLTHVIEGCAEGFQALRDAGKYLTFITNNSVRGEEHCLAKLYKNNIKIDAKDLMHPAKSIVEYLKDINFKGTIYALASQNFIDVLRKEGYTVLEGPNIIIAETFEEILSNVVSQDEVNAVVIDFDFNITLTKMMKAHFFLRKPDCLLIGGASDCLIPLTKDMSFLGPGGFAKILEQTNRREMLLFGKPGKALAEILLKRNHVKEHHRVLMIGDMLDQDIRFARECGFQSLLVLSGGTTLEDMMAQTDLNVIPNYFTNSIGDFVEFFKDIKKSHV